MRGNSLSTRYWRALTGVNPVLESLTGDWQLSPGTADVGELALWKFFGDGYGRFYRGKSHFLSRLRSHFIRRAAVPLEERTPVGALLEGVQYMMDFQGSKLARDFPRDPGNMIAEEWNEMMREIDEFLSGNRNDREE